MKPTDIYETIKNNTPNDLTSLSQWVAWSGTEGRNGKTVKIPINPKSGKPAKTNDPDTWASFEEALSYSRQNHLPGVGFVFTDADEFVGIDIDHCIDPDTGVINNEAMNIVDRMDSYAEISPSGRGLHIFVRGALPEGPRRNGKVEMYDCKRFFTVTGDIFAGSPCEVKDRQDELLDLYTDLFVPTPAKGQNRENNLEIDDLLIQAAKINGNGDKFSRLWNGDYRGYASQSEADLALCRLLAFYTNCDAGEIDRLFRESGLYRPKWDQPHFAGGKTYGKATVEKAVSSADERYAEPGQSSHRTIGHRDFHLTDLGNAERLVHHFGERIRYCHLWKKWLIWDEVRWMVDHTDQIRQLAKQVIRKIYREAEAVSDPGKRQAIAKHAMASESDKRIKAMISLAESELPITPEELDRDPWLLTCLNGTLDLRKNILLPHKREDFITKLAPVAYDPKASSKSWLDFLDRIMASNPKLISFLQRAIGYSLTGDTSEQCMFILHGSGANGKSTFLQTIAFVLGDYAMSTPTDTLLVKQKGAISNDVARLKGARFVTASEAEAGQQLAESLIKQMTGGVDVISARFLHQEFFDFAPTHKIFLGTNHKPVIKGTDPAIWRRIRLVPFEVTIPEAERDKNLFQKLKKEAESIFAWAVKGCQLWRTYELGEPEEVKAATESYREEMDTLAEFIKDRCVLRPDARVLRKALFDAYVEWCQEDGQAQVNSRSFVAGMRDKGFVECRAGLKGMRAWEGIELAIASVTSHFPSQE